MCKKFMQDVSNVRWSPHFVDSHKLYTYDGVFAKGALMQFEDNVENMDVSDCYAMQPTHEAVVGVLARFHHRVLSRHYRRQLLH